MTDAFLDDHDGVGLAELVRSGDLGRIELLDAVLARIAERDPAINAVVDVFADRARARLADAPIDGPLAGVPLLVKDLFTDVAGELTTNGSRFFADARATSTSPVVERLEAAGMVATAKTNSPELGLSPTTEPALHGATRNPWDHTRTPGGSSGGAAAAVAAGFVPLAHATDGGGSIRIPASACGLVGLKPSRRTSPATRWLSVHGVVSRTVRDTAAALEAIAEPNVVQAGEWRAAVDRAPRPLRIGVNTTGRPTATTASACVAAVERAAALLTELGHTVEPVDLGIDFDAMGFAQSTITAAHTNARIRARSEELGRPPGDDDLQALARLQHGRSATAPAADYALAEDALDALLRQQQRVHRAVDLVLTPTLASPPPRLGTLEGPTEDIMTWGPAMADLTGFLTIANLTGQPAISLPLHHDEDGLPIGVQLVASDGGEALLLQVAGQLERAAPWADRRPPR